MTPKTCTSGNFTDGKCDYTGKECPKDECVAWQPKTLNQELEKGVIYAIHVLERHLEKIQAEKPLEKKPDCRHVRGMYEG